uniref:Uncharacterized protein n=1 Tax=Brassica campestris TaxID=3711 RepID=M4EV74_BRACM
MKKRDKAGERLHRYHLPSLVLIASVSSHTPSPIFSPPPSLLIDHIISLHSLIDHASSLHSLFPIASSTLPHPLSPTPHFRDLSLPSSPTLIAGTSFPSLNAHPSLIAYPHRWALFPFPHRPPSSPLCVHSFHRPYLIAMLRRSQSCH